MKAIPVTPILLQILEDAHGDALATVNELERELEKYTSYDNSVKGILVENLESRHQKVAILKDIIKRYS